MWTPNKVGTHDLILSQEGVTQGCALGTFLFNLGIHNPVVIKINKILKSIELNAGMAIAIHDDINILMKPEHLHILYPQLINIFNSIGLEMNLNKSIIYTNKMNPEEIIQHIPNQIPHSSEGIEMVGAPLGNNVFCETFWEKSLVEKLQESIPLICTWYDTQRALCLFRLCITTTTNYFCRMTSPSLPYASSITTKFENLFKDALAYLIGREQDVNVAYRQYITDDVWLHATLPAKLGGLSIIIPKAIHSAAYI